MIRDREVENPMVIDSLWDELDQVDREQEEEDFYIRADMEYEDELEDLQRGWGHVNGYYL